jgi:hypothetical protein
VTIVRGIRRAGSKDHRALEWLAEHCHADAFCPPKEQQVNAVIKRGRDGLLPSSMFFSGISHLTDLGISEAPKLFIETEPLVNYQGNSAEAEPMDDPFLEGETQTACPKKQANGSAGA